MSKEQLKLEAYLNHILEAIKRIDRYVEDIDEPNFLSNEMIQDAVVRNLEIIGEASRNVQRDYSDFIKKHPDILFSSAYEMRNALSHGYFSVDYEIVWKTIERDLPIFEEQIRKVTITSSGKHNGSS
jgi:uncharacterized protein with HEPN domain